MLCVIKFQFPSGKISYLTGYIYTSYIGRYVTVSIPLREDILSNNFRIISNRNDDISFQFPSGKISYLTFSKFSFWSLHNLFQFPSGKISYLTFILGLVALFVLVVSIPLREDILSNERINMNNRKKKERKFQFPSGKISYLTPNTHILNLLTRLFQFPSGKISYLTKTNLHLSNVPTRFGFNSPQGRYLI